MIGTVGGCAEMSQSAHLEIREPTKLRGEALLF